DVLVEVVPQRLQPGHFPCQDFLQAMLDAPGLIRSAHPKKRVAQILFIPSMMNNLIGRLNPAQKEPRIGVRLLQKPSTTLPPQKRIVIGRWHAAAAPAGSGHADRPARVGAPLGQRLGANGPDTGQTPLPLVKLVTEEQRLLAALSGGRLGGHPLDAAGGAIGILDDALLNDKPARKWGGNRSILRPTTHDLSLTEKLAGLLIGSSRH